ncbi:MAG: hypothetical protein IT514_15520 [Burkholderiales bacterium]|nr:hypothetical protein [Burkholderiales bacterium]
MLLRYRTVEDLARYRPDMRELPLPVHGALVDRLRVALARRGIRVRVVWMEREAYDAWRGRRRDAEDVRAAWAALQITAAPAAAPEA